MSNRTLVEINHDFTPSTDEELLKWAREFKYYLSSGDKDLLPNGVRYFGMRHHSQGDPVIKYDR